MALSKSVTESLEEAESNLRNALAYAARQEKPFVCNIIAEMINKIDSMKQMDNILDTLENRSEGDRGTWGPIVE